MKLNVDFSDLYKNVEEMGAELVDIDLKLSDEKISASCAGEDLSENPMDATGQKKHTQNKST